MTTKIANEEAARKMYEKAREIMGILNEAGLRTDFHHVSIGMKDQYIRIDIHAEEGTYEICTIGENEKPRISFTEA